MPEYIGPLFWLFLLYLVDRYGRRVPVEEEQ